MGNDGGNIAQRIDLCKTKQKPMKRVDKNAQKSSVKLCAIGKNQLKPPICCCRKGHLFSKINAVQALIQKTMPSNLSHIKSSKDFKEIKTVNNEAEFKVFCPVSSTEFNGVSDFFLFWGCGCSISADCFDKLSLTQKEHFVCPNCSKDVFAKDVIKLVREIEMPNADNQTDLKERAIEVKLGKKDFDESNKFFVESLAEKAGDNSIYKNAIEGLFHKKVKVENAEKLLIRDCRNGIR